MKLCIFKIVRFELKPCFRLGTRLRGCDGCFLQGSEPLLRETKRVYTLK